MSLDVTNLLNQSAEGNVLAMEQLFPVVYDELRGIVGCKLSDYISLQVIII